MDFLISAECVALSFFVLMPETRSFGVLCTPDDYYIVAGPHSFVRIALGSDIEEARKSFVDFGSNEGWPDATRKHFLSVASIYEPFNGSLSEGSGATGGTECVNGSERPTD